MTRDMCHIWRSQGIHEQAVHGHWRNGMSNHIDGSEDGSLTAAPVFFEENNLKEVREKIVNDTIHEYKADRLPWGYKTVRSLIALFPKTGHLDVYRGGQSDEGDADCHEGS